MPLDLKSATMFRIKGADSINMFLGPNPPTGFRYYAVMKVGALNHTCCQGWHVNKESAAACLLLSVAQPAQKHEEY